MNNLHRRIYYAWNGQKIFTKLRYSILNQNNSVKSFVRPSPSSTHCEYRGRILGRNPDKSPRSFPPCYSQSPLCSFALRFLFLQTHATSYSFYRPVTIKEKGGTLYRKLQPPSLWFKKSIQKPQDYAQIAQRNCTFMNSASVLQPSF